MNPRTLIIGSVLGALFYALIAFIVWAFVAQAYAHGGGTDERVCHTDRETLAEHCHRQQPEPLSAELSLSDGVARVVDGDTFEVNETKFRIFGIDAPETDQICRLDSLPWPCGEDATDALEEMLNGHLLMCDTKDIDRYGRPVVECESAGRNVGAEMVRLGWALDYVKYSNGAYAAEQAEAKAAKRGLWAGEFMPPWQWRKR